MRKPFCNTLLARAAQPEFVFLTGDLGFGALEPLRQAMGPRFINAGVAEQNMIGVAAGLAREGFRPWAYSIAPFVYARPFEQIRNDLCLHRLPAILVGNGGGYAYGVMGATHHALEDYGVLLTLPDLSVFIPAFDADIEPVIDLLLTIDHTAYLRLGLDESPQSQPRPAFAPWRLVLDGAGPPVVAVGPLAGYLWSAWSELPIASRPAVWALCQLPIHDIPDRLLRDIQRTGALAVVEEHVAHGSAGADLATALLSQGIGPKRMSHHVARGYPSHRYGSQRFHRRDSGIDASVILQSLAGAIQGASHGVR